MIAVRSEAGRLNLARDTEAGLQLLLETLEQQKAIVLRRWWY